MTCSAEAMQECMDALELLKKRESHHAEGASHVDLARYSFVSSIVELCKCFFGNNTMRVVALSCACLECVLATEANACTGSSQAEQEALRRVLRSSDQV